MSASIPESGGTSEPILAGMQSTLNVKIAVYNEKKGQWETPKLKDDEKREIISALDSIRFKQKDNPIGQALNQVGSVFAFTKGQILEGRVLEGGNRRWGQDVLTGSSREQKQEVKKVINTVTSVLGQVSKKKEVQQLETQTRKVVLEELLRHDLVGKVFIEVEVVPTISTLDKALEHEVNFFSEIEALNDYLTDPDWVSFLESKGLDSQSYQSVSEHYQALRVAAEGAQIVLNETGRLLSEDRHAAISYYMQHMPAALKAYWDALRVWQTDQWALNQVLGPDREANPFQLKLENCIPRHLTICTQLMYLADKEFPADFQFHKSTLQQVAALYTSQKNYYHLRDFIIERQKELKQAEKKLLDEIDTALWMLSPSNTEERENLTKKHKFKDDEINAHIERLRTFQKATEELVATVDSMGVQLSYGDLQGALDDYQNWINTRYLSYQLALKEVILFQVAAKGRIDAKPYFDFDWKQTQPHEDFLSRVSAEIENFPVLDGTNEKVVNATPFAITLVSLRVYREEALTFVPQFTAAMNDLYGRLRVQIQRVGEFVSKFTQNRSLFEAMMRKQGYSDLETAYMFNAAITSYEDFIKLREEFEKVTEKANAANYTQAMDNLAKFFTDQVIPMMDKHRVFLLVSERIDNLSDVVRKFILRTTGKDQMQLALSITGFTKFFTNASLEIRNAIDAYRQLLREGEQVPDSILEAQRKVLAATERANDFSQERRLYEVHDRFFRLFNYDDIKKNPEWRRILRKYGWSDAQIVEFNNVYNAYARLIEPLQKAEIAIATEADPEKRRMLKIQLRTLANQNLPQMIKLRSRFEALGGMDRLSQLRSATAEFISIRLKGKTPFGLRQQLEERFNENAQIFDAMHMHSFEDFIEKFDTTRMTSPEAQSIFQTQFRVELQLFRDLRFAEGFQKEVNDVVGLMTQRQSFIKNIYESAQLILPWKFGVVENKLIKIYRQEIQLQGTLKAIGWNDRNIRTFSQAYDSYIRAYQPLFLAKQALDEDPENIYLQQELKRVYKKQLSEINDAADRLSLYRMKNIHALSDALEEYSANLVAELNAITSEPARLTFEQLERIRQIKEATSQLRVLNFADNIAGTDRWLKKLDRDLSFPMSWEEDFFGALFDKKSFIYALKVDNKSLFEKILKRSEISLSPHDLALIKNLLWNFQRHLKEIHRLERELEADPSNDELRTLLHKAFLKKAKDFEALESRYNELYISIQAFDEAIYAFRGECLEIYIQIKIKEAEIFDRPAGRTDEQQALLVRNLEIYRQNTAGGFSDEDLEALIADLQRFKVQEACSEKLRVKDQVKSHLYRL